MLGLDATFSKHRGIRRADTRSVNARPGGVGQPVDGTAWEIGRYGVVNNEDPLDRKKCVLHPPTLHLFDGPTWVVSATRFSPSQQLQLDAGTGDARQQEGREHR